MSYINISPDALVFSILTATQTVLSGHGELKEFSSYMNSFLTHDADETLLKALLFSSIIVDDMELEGKALQMLLLKQYDISTLNEYRKIKEDLTESSYIKESAKFMLDNNLDALKGHKDLETLTKGALNERENT